MKSQHVAHAFIAGTLLFWISILVQVTYYHTVSADMGDTASSCSVQQDFESGDCAVPANTAKTWVDEVGDKFYQFLQEKVFGQEDAAAKDGSTSGSKGSFMELLDEEHHGKQNQATSTDFVIDNPVLRFISRMIGNLSDQDGMTANEKKEGNDEDSNPFHTLLDRLVEIGKLEDNEVLPSQMDGSPGNEELAVSLLRRVKLFHEDDLSIGGLDFWSTIRDALDSALVQLKNTFGHILDEVDSSLALSMVYYLADEDSRKHPSWKRQQHRFYEEVSKSMVVELHDALYLSELSYVHSVDDFKKGLAKFKNNEWEIAYGSTDSLPNLPAHFLMIHKNLAPLDNPSILSNLPWERNKNSELTVLLVIRGTKDLPDALADALLEPAEYRGGYAHGGILQSGKNLAERYLPKLRALLKSSGQQRVRLYLVGHSLGAGAAAIAAMEFNDHEWIDVKAVGFGCPSLLSRELSEAAKEYVTTVIADSDIVPRMSGASMANLLLDIIEFDWTKTALEDIEFTLERATTVLPFGQLLPAANKDKILDWVKTIIERDIRPKFQKEKHQRISTVLIPPGDCIHFYRDGVGYSGVFTPCSFFDSIDVSRTLVDDHLVVPGYHRALVTITRDWENNYNYDFPHDIAAIRT